MCKKYAISFYVYRISGSVLHFWELGCLNVLELISWNLTDLAMNNNAIQSTAIRKSLRLSRAISRYCWDISELPIFPRSKNYKSTLVLILFPATKTSTLHKTKSFSINQVQDQNTLLGTFEICIMSWIFVLNSVSCLTSNSYARKSNEPNAGFTNILKF